MSISVSPANAGSVLVSDAALPSTTESRMVSAPASTKIPPPSA
jgi:hypothetical protein